MLGRQTCDEFSQRCLANQHLFLSTTAITSIFILENCQIYFLVNCGRNITLIDESEITFTSPGYPNSYPNNLFCRWFVTVTQGLYVSLKLEDFETESFDLVEVSIIQS